ncbi:MAG: hypothetical protein E6J88_05060 [Deltaproteobacteria bacterium]|nr:MAG: hypothetical protein E6J88_05060 [Deltaproteobacteria bacterium]
MKLFGRKPTLEEAVELIRAELREGRAPQTLVDELRRREPLISGGREPPRLQELLEAVPGAAALLEVGARIVARNARMEQLLGGAPTVLEAARSDELVDLCARGLAGWPHQRELALPALGLQIQAQVTPLSHAGATSSPTPRTSCARRSPPSAAPPRRSCTAASICPSRRARSSR